MNFVFRALCLSIAASAVLTLLPSAKISADVNKDFGNHPSEFLFGLFGCCDVCGPCDTCCEYEDCGC